ncbi:MAG: UDP-glucose 4-epimerase GalE [Martelella sp.]|uniref:UDP-glucose 4-epimerase GalE n=1 Tax=unclassified Martelella TaxID=2629616 RepID=UPI000C638794|nr:UDP-glucose 4-epimerase GalE [Martelella sp.]MAU19105.1 UDP-glucose 4-epimerase GalE [Martelella sp.]|tara:strand:- start:113 stop:1105 length:993 start_codon:yes stop_codon:yes gene_type:complete
MTILVTGGAGYVGSHMAYALVDRGEKVVVLDDLSTGHGELVPEAAKLVKGDIADAKLVSRLIADEGINAIAHFAGSIVVSDSVADPLTYYENNTVKSRALIETAVAAKVEAFLFSSTAAVYGEPGADLLDEEQNLQPVSPYGWSKLMTEVMLRDSAAAYGLKYAALRYFNVAGADPEGRTGETREHATHLIEIAAQAATGRRNRMEVFGTDYPTPDGTCLRDYIHVTDLIDAHVKALMHLLNGGENFVANCGYGHGFSVLQVVDAIKRVSGVDFRVDMSDRRPGDPPALVADSARVREILGWEPQYDDLDTIVKHALAWEDQLVKGRVKL